MRFPSRLSPTEREEISRGLQAAASFRGLAARLGCSPSTVSRKMSAHGGRDKYRAWRADERAVRRTARPIAERRADSSGRRNTSVVEVLDGPV
ncbi:MAG: helix-turn-helix domain-containing protein, partial [Fimbriimonadaceae bacterium]|nr:helix-turn-helix domain-containing protein [Fimbriimonadaceae bacterium]